jgi:hypothetical protein
VRARGLHQRRLPLVGRVPSRGTPSAYELSVGCPANAVAIFQRDGRWFSLSSRRESPSPVGRRERVPIPNRERVRDQARSSLPTDVSLKVAEPSRLCSGCSNLFDRVKQERATGRASRPAPQFHQNSDAPVGNASVTARKVAQPSRLRVPAASRRAE